MTNESPTGFAPATGSAVCRWMVVSSQGRLEGNCNAPAEYVDPLSGYFYCDAHRLRFGERIASEMQRLPNNEMTDRRKHEKP